MDSVLPTTWLATGIPGSNRTRPPLGQRLAVPIASWSGSQACDQSHQKSHRCLPTSFGAYWLIEPKPWEMMSGQNARCSAATRLAE